MDFFSAQDEARKNTKWLVLLFTLAVVSMNLLLYLAIVSATFNSGDGTMGEPVHWWRPEVLLIVFVATTGVILFGSLFKILSLARGGGESVAASLGGRRVSRGTGDALERRLLNVVDEMAIASGVPVPKVYILDEESAINAFAAGVDMHSAVIAVTRGCLEQLSRDELQGVVAHEFSHIFNGDMRLNIRLIGILHGILLLALAGRMILRGGGRSRSRNAGGVVAAGLALLVVGYTGLFFGRVIKAAVSRQREFLADAAAVQFTRNPSGLSGALKKIGGFSEKRIVHPNAEEASHMFFDAGVVMHLNLLATHPPLVERINRLEPMFRAEISRTPIRGAAEAAANDAITGLVSGESVRVSPGDVQQSVGNFDERHLGYAHALLDTLPTKVSTDVHDAKRARAVVYALLAGSLDNPAQLSPMLQDEDDEIITLTAEHVITLSEGNRAVRLPLIELAIPAIREVDGDRAAVLIKNCRTLVAADKRVTVFEFAVLSLLEHAFGLDGKRYRHLRSVPLSRIRKDCEVLFSLLAHVGHRENDAAISAFRVAWERILLEGEGEFLERNQITMPIFSETLSRLNRLKFSFKARIVEACVEAIAEDGRITLAEAELLRVIGARLDCPIPPILPGSVAR